MYINHLYFFFLNNLFIFSLYFLNVYIYYLLIYNNALGIRNVKPVNNICVANIFLKVIKFVLNIWYSNGLNNI